MTQLRIKVLIVEDDPMVAEIHRRYIMQLEGFSLAGVARSGDEALKILEREPVQLVMLDIYIPGVNGLEFLSVIRGRGHAVDVIVVSAAREPDVVSKALRFGAVDYLVKPFEFERLSASLKAYQERLAVIEGNLSLDQSMIDKEVLGKFASVDAPLPKGLEKNTLKIILNAVQVTNATFSTEEMAGKVGISRVSMRKYLKYLEDHGVLQVEISHGSVGRPVYKYRCIKKEWSNNRITLDG